LSFSSVGRGFFGRSLRAFRFVHVQTGVVFVITPFRAFRFIHTQTGLQEPFPKLNEWLHRVTSRPAVARGFDVPDPSDHIKNDFKIAMSKEEVEEKAKEATKWIMASKTDGE
jgi:hypothetical protein